MSPHNTPPSSASLAMVVVAEPLSVTGKPTNSGVVVDTAVAVLSQAAVARAAAATPEEVGEKTACVFAFVSAASHLVQLAHVAVVDVQQRDEASVELTQRPLRVVSQRPALTVDAGLEPRCDVEVDERIVAAGAVAQVVELRAAAVQVVGEPGVATAAAEVLGPQPGYRVDTGDAGAFAAVVAQVVRVRVEPARAGLQVLVDECPVAARAAPGVLDDGDRVDLLWQRIGGGRLRGKADRKHGQEAVRQRRAVGSACRGSPQS